MSRTAEPGPADSPWRRMPDHAPTPHVSGTTLDAPRRAAADPRICRAAWPAGRPAEEDHVIVSDGEIVGGAHRTAFSR